jgi:F-type H+-transporting ATPase subunit b
MKLLPALFLALICAAPAVAAEEHAASINELVFPLINFLIFLYLIKRFLLPVAREHLRGRREEIASAVKEADEARKQAEAMLSDYKNRLARLNEETKSILDAFRAEGEREKSKLLTEADELGKRLNADADLLTEQEIRSARQELRREIARAARAAAERLVQENLDAADRQRLLADFLSEVGEAR